MLTIHDYVHIKDTVIEGEIIRINKAKKTYIIQTDQHCVQVSFQQVELAKRPQKKRTLTTYTLSTHTPIATEIMLRHQTVEEALYHLDIFIDQAVLHHLPQVKIIHGRSGGILRKAVHIYLKEHPQIESYRLGNYFEGSYGVTIATLRL